MTIGARQRLRVRVEGTVQGVGFRPFVYRLATELGLRGWINNSPQGVFIEVEGAVAKLDKFVLRLKTEKPPRSSIQNLEISSLKSAGYQDFAVKVCESCQVQRSVYCS